VTCLAGRPVEYRKLAGIIFKVPECWSVEVSSLLDREVHRFHDPEARAGTLSISLEPAATKEDTEALQNEFERLARRPAAVVDGVKGAGPGGPSIAPAASLRPSGFDGLAERILHPDPGGPAAETSTTRGASAGSRLFRRVEVGGLIGPLDERGSATGSGPDHAKRTWHWLLIGDRLAVRMVYAVRADWADSPVIAEEFKRVEAVADSIRPAP
jgi:hypothetical protein